jgi:hypothetical protein
MGTNRYRGAGLVLVLTTLATFLPALADIQPGQNVLGISTDPNESGVFELADYPVGPLQVHLMVYGYRHAQGIVAWRCAVDLPEGLTFAGVTLAGDGVNSRHRPWSFDVITRQPLLPVDGMIHLATLDLVNTNLQDKQVFIVPEYPWGNEGFMGFAKQTDERIGTRLHWPRNCESCPVFELTSAPQAAGDMAWDQVKSLYR